MNYRDLDKKLSLPQWDNPHENFNKAPAKKTPLTVEDLFPRIDRWGIGFDPVFDTLRSLSKTTAPSYPPYNIIKYSDDKWDIEMALAGFSKSDIDVVLERQSLVISNKVKEDHVKDAGEIVHRGIAMRDFSVSFALAEHVLVESAKMQDGVLRLSLVRDVPEENKPKSIAIK